MFGTKSLSRLSYPLCLTLTCSGMAWADEPHPPGPMLPPATEIEVEAPLGTGVLQPIQEAAPLVPPLPESIDEPIPPVAQSVESADVESADVESAEDSRGDDETLEPLAVNAEPKRLVHEDPAEEVLEATEPVLVEETQPALTRPFKTSVADPLAELRAQQEALRQQQHALEAEVIETAPHSVMVPQTNTLQPIEQADLPTVDPDTIEVVRQRFPDGSIKLAYEVGRDANDNYVKHGDWKLFNMAGKVIAQGEYRNNKRHGQWRRWHNGVESAMFLQTPYTQFTPPFYSEAQFKFDELDGTWTITDSQQRTASEIHFRNGLRHGKATWWHTSGNLMQEIDFVDGELHGELNLWTAEGQRLAHQKFIHGRRDAPKVTKYPNGQKKSEGSILEARTFITEPDDWWNAKTAVFTKEGRDEKHGLWRQWHPNGTLHVEGTYEHHVENGTFTWWYATGQKALVGQYADGQRQGQWRWWHTNGQKHSEGTFSADQAIADWIWWNEDGSVARRIEKGDNDPTSRTAEGKSGNVKPTTFQEPAQASGEPKLLPVPGMIR